MYLRQLHIISLITLFKLFKSKLLIVTKRCFSCYKAVVSRLMRKGCWDCSFSTNGLVSRLGFRTNELLSRLGFRTNGLVSRLGFRWRDDDVLCTCFNRGTLRSCGDDVASLLSLAASNGVLSSLGVCGGESGCELSPLPRPLLTSKLSTGTRLFPDGSQSPPGPPFFPDFDICSSSMSISSNVSPLATLSMRMSSARLLVEALTGGQSGCVLNSSSMFWYSNAVCLNLFLIGSWHFVFIQLLSIRNVCQKEKAIYFTWFSRRLY